MQDYSSTDIFLSMIILIIRAPKIILLSEASKPGTETEHSIPHKFLNQAHKLIAQVLLSISWSHNSFSLDHYCMGSYIPFNIIAKIK